MRKSQTLKTRTLSKCGHSFLSSFSNNSVGSKQTCDSLISDGCMPQCIRNPWAVYINTSAHSYSHVKSMFLTSWTVDLDHIQWEHWEATGQEGPEGAWNAHPDESEPKGYNNDTVEMCISSWKRSLAVKRKGLSGYKGSQEGKASFWHGHYRRCQHGSDRCNKLILTSFTRNNASESWPRKLAGMVTCAETQMESVHCIMLSILKSNSTVDSIAVNSQICCSQLHFINNN